MNLQLSEIKSIELINDDSIGPSYPQILFTLSNGELIWFFTKFEQRKAIRWVKENLPEKVEILQKLLAVKPFEDYLIAVIYEKD